MRRTTCPDNVGHVRLAVDGHPDGQHLSGVSGVRLPCPASVADSSATGSRGAATAELDPLMVEALASLLSDSLVADVLSEPRP